MHGFQLLRTLAEIALSLALVGWVFVRWFKNSDDRLRLVTFWAMSAVILGVVLWTAFSAGSSAELQIVSVLAGAMGGLLLAVIWVPRLCDWVGRKIGSLYTGGEDENAVPPPFYSIAEARRKKGQFEEAEAEVRGQLSLHPTDFTGWLMLAEIQAENRHDVSGAAASIEELISQEEHSSKNKTLALHRLADWQLKAGEPDAARLTLQRIIDLFPESEMSQTAAQRIGHLTGQEEMQERAREPRSIVLKPGMVNVGLHQGPVAAPAAMDPAVLANEYVKHLNDHPLDAEVRQKLALLYADGFNRLGLAVGQLEEMIGSPHPSPKDVARWLNLEADLHIRLGANLEEARRALERIRERFPHSAWAEQAGNRIALLGKEMRQKEKGRVLKLGTYDRYPGLSGFTDKP